MAHPFTAPLDSASLMSRLRARSPGGLRRSSGPSAGAYARQQRLGKGLLRALDELGPAGLARLRARPAQRQRRPGAMQDRVIKLSDEHVEITQALLEQRGLWPALDFAFQPLHQRTAETEDLFFDLGLS